MINIPASLILGLLSLFVFARFLVATARPEINVIDGAGPGEFQENAIHTPTATRNRYRFSSSSSTSKLTLMNAG